MPNAAELAYLEYLAEEERDHQRLIQAYRDYYDGDQESYLSDHLQEFLDVDGDDDFSMNVCRTVIQSISERLILSGFSVTGSTNGAQDIEGSDMGADVDDFVVRFRRANQIAARQGSVHEGALRDGEYFAILDKPSPEAVPQIIFHKRFVSTEAGGDGDGCKARYANDDPDQELEYVSRRWYKLLPGGSSIHRFNIYYPDRIEKYEIVGGVPRPFVDPQDEGVWPISWLDADGEPLGIPVAHFKCPGLRSELADALSGQNIVNMTIADMLGSARVSAFRIMLLSGFIPTSDGKKLAVDLSNMLKLKPGTWLNTEKPPSEVGLTAIDGEDPTPMANLINNELLWFAVITGTPVSRFQFTGQIASEKTLKQQDESLLAKVANRQVLFGDAWEQCAQIAIRLENAFGVGPKLDEDTIIDAVWKVTQPRDEMTLSDKREKLEIPLASIWAEAGYSQDEIEQMLEKREEEMLMKARIATTNFSAPVEEGE